MECHSRPRVGGTVAMAIQWVQDGQEGAQKARRAPWGTVRAYQGLGVALTGHMCRSFFGIALRAPPRLEGTPIAVRHMPLEEVAQTG